MLLDRFPGPETLHPSTRKWLGVLAIGLSFIVLGAWFIHAPGSFSDSRMAQALGVFLTQLGLARDTTGAVAEFGWVTVVFFGIGAGLSLLTLLPGAAGLTLDRDGFVVHSLFRRRTYRWADVDAFTVTEVGYGRGSKKLVGFDDRLAAASAIARANVKLTGRNSALPDTYGLSAEDLVLLMSRWQQKCS